MWFDYTKISFTQMWYFIRVVEIGSLSRTAQVLKVSQPTLSKSIQSLENNLGMRLFLREKKKLIITDAGIALYQSWGNLFLEIEASIEQARQSAGGRIKTLRIATLDSHLSENYLLDRLEEYEKKYPDVTLLIEARAPEVLRQKMISGDYDVVFTVRYEVEYDVWDGFESRLIEECPLTVGMRSVNPLSEKGSVTLEDLKDMDLVVVSSVQLPSYTRMIKQCFSSVPFEPNMIRSTNSANAQIFNIRKETDVFIIDPFHRDSRSEKMEFRPLEGTKSGVCMVWNADETRQEVLNFLAMFPDVACHIGCPPD